MPSTQSLLLGFLMLSAAPSPAQSPDPVFRAAELIERRQVEEARRLLEPYARANPGDARAAALMGRSYLEDAQHDRAVEWLERAVHLDARSAARAALKRLDG